MKKAIALATCCTTLFSIAACGGGEGGGKSGMISTKPLTVAELGEGFNAKYLPDASSIRQFSGKIDVCLDFEGTQDGWRALAKEYERLQDGGVKVNINTNFAGTSYTENLRTELTSVSTDWDIVEGNLGLSNTRSKCVDMKNTINTKNPYCGADTKIWADVLDDIAYKTKEADTSGQSYILNTEVMQTAWFVNDVALQAAVDKGYKNADNEAGYPITWDDLILLCEKMVEAGYPNPLGISLCQASIDSLQFTWLLRVYGDYYYRQYYQYIVGFDPEYVWDNYDPTAKVVETNEGFSYSFAKVLNMLFEEDSPFGDGYIGFTSDVYLDFVSNLAKMEGYFFKDAATTEFSALRDEFRTQSDGVESPQIMLDYLGFGINYENAEKDGFSVGYFDYPTMESEYVPAETITRDIGGNGGFLSVVNHIGDKDQVELNKDFIKFVMSPYGQTIYYKGLAEAGRVPKGLSTVKNDLVVIPATWKTFFEESEQTIKFNGDVDANPFLSWGVRYVVGKSKTQSVICEYWRNLLLLNTMTVPAFAAKWDEAVRADKDTVVKENGWGEKFWQNTSKIDK